MADLLSLSRRADGRTLWQLCEKVETSHLGFEVRPLPGKGLGVIVTRIASFARGERILCEEPLIAWRSSPGPSGTHDWNSLESQVEADTRRDDFYSLCDKFSDSGNGLAKTARGIWNSNSFPMEDIIADGLAAAKDGVHRSAVYRLCSRINHSCRPNCFAAWNALLGRQTLHALRDIGQGEELTVAYVGGAEAGVRASRRQMLADKYHFDCACEACSLKVVTATLNSRLLPPTPPLLSSPRLPTTVLGYPLLPTHPGRRTCSFRAAAVTDARHPRSAALGAGPPASLTVASWWCHRPLPQPPGAGSPDSPGCATHSRRATDPPRAQWPAAVRP